MPTFGRLSPEAEAQLEAKCVALGGTVTRARPPGVCALPPGQASTAKKKRTKTLLLDEEFIPPASWVIPIHVIPGDNGQVRSKSQRFGRSGYERAVVHRAMAKQYAALTPFVKALHAGKTIRIRFTKFGPNRMDPMNVSAAMKYLVDAVADRFGLDDSNPLYDWQVAPQQKSRRHGVRIDISFY